MSLKILLSAISVLTATGLAIAAEAKTSPARPLFKDFMGVNGHTVQFKPELYRPTGRLVRDYHNIQWDLGEDTDFVTTFPFARNRVNWETVYGSWQKEGYEVNVSIMFPELHTNHWKDLPRDAFAYGKAFATAFGPSGKLPLVASAEIGNEPGHYADEDYRKLFENMAKGFRAGDPKMQIVTCALIAGKSHAYAKSVTCVEGLEALYDVINLHTYAEAEPWPTWRRSYPEDTSLRYLKDVQDLIAWRDKQAPGKPIWITEFGYDSSTKPAPKEGNFAKWMGNTDEQQAQYLVRSYLVFATLAVDRAYIFFFNDSDEPQVHGSSGLTRNFEPKPSYYAVSHQQKVLGDYRFERPVKEVANNVYAYEFVHGTNAKQKIWCVWSPTGSGRKATVTLPLGKLQVKKAEHMPLAKGDATPAKTEVKDGQLQLEISEAPVYVWLE